MVVRDQNLRGALTDPGDRAQQAQRFTPLLADAARFARHSPGGRWFVDETYVKVNGVWRYVYRAVDQHGQVIDVLLSTRRDAAAARRFFTRALRTLKVIPREVVTDAAPVYRPCSTNWSLRRGTTSSSMRTTG
jgi:transposase-like protein